MGILFGDDSIGVIHPFSKQLKEQTRLEAERRDGRAYALIARGLAPGRP